MRNLVVIGGQWGDEGKGKIVDLICQSFDTVVRYQGGNNAGHTVKIGDNQHALHLIPSGIFNGKTGVLGNGMVIDPVALLEEMDALPESCDRANILVSGRAHVVLPHHKLFDWAAGQGIGTTQKGIGPAYTAKARRTGAVRIVDLTDKERMAALLDSEIPRALSELQHAVDEEQLREKIRGGFADFYDEERLLSSKRIAETYHAAGTRLAPHVRNTAYIVNDKERRLLFEGAQGVLLDIDHGTFPYVTSSSIARGGVHTGSGYSGPVDCLAIVKAYTTRVGEGPFPTELTDETGELLRSKGREFGTTTGRPRRCGWLDVAALSYAHMITGFTDLAITKLDILSGLDTVRICVGYRKEGQQVDEFPQDAAALEACEPVYETLQGWSEDIAGITKYEGLPDACRAYLERIEHLLGVPIAIVSVGPERTQTIVRKQF